MNLCIVKHGNVVVSETFIRAQVNRLPANVTLVEGTIPAHIRGAGRLGVWMHLMWYKLTGRTPSMADVTRAYAKVLRRTKADAVLAQYGTTGVQVREACVQGGVPLIVHFHGYDASRRGLLRKLRTEYERLFEQAAALVVVSHAMERRLLELGAPADKLHYSPCGADCAHFAPTDPAANPPVFVAVGRFVEKKAPDETVRAFAALHRLHPEARLRMIGDGNLLKTCQALAYELGVADAVDFLGAQPHQVVRREMAGARAFVQHSVEAKSGDCEGTPVAVLEAGASGLPVISTRHAGIPDVVEEGETGLLVDEHDVAGMARYMVALTEDPKRAAQLGAAGRRRVIEHYSMERNMDRLWKAISTAVDRGEEAKIHKAYSKDS